MTTTEYIVTGMTCGHCASSVREEVTKLAGVQNVEVDLATGLLRIDSAAPPVEADVLAAVDEAGYRAEAK